MISSLLLAFAIFKGLRVINVEGWLVDWLEALDHGAIIIVFVLFLFRVIRQSFALSIRRK
jgi:hypothetical protein